MKTDNKLPLCVLLQLEPIVKRIEDLERDSKRKGNKSQKKKYSKVELGNLSWHVIADLADVTMQHGHSPVLDELKERAYKLMSL